jgi:glycine/D-amino acid oxidase-like deaminating enzyme/nitrite reductase/ring-hydroxylating ferredoxin subunit
MTNPMNKPYWSDTASLPEFKPITADLDVDVVIVGGGITGITAAYLLKQAGATFALLERDSFASADTGCTTAHLTCVTDTRLTELVKSFGRDHALAVWDAGRAAIDQISSIIDEHQIQCEFTIVPGFLHQPRIGGKEKEAACLKEDAANALELGIDAKFVDRAPLVLQPAVRFPNQAKFHPRKYLGALLNAARGEGCHLYEKSPVDEIQDQPLQVKSRGCTIHCGRILIATHVPLQGLVNTMSATLFQTKLALYTSYAVGAKVASGVLPAACFWDTNDPYDYLRIDRGEHYDYAIYGGEDHKTGQESNPAARFDSLQQKVEHLLPGAKVEHRWSGQVIETPDGLPYIGETVPGQFIATGFSGNGMTFGTLAAMMFCDELAGRKNPWRDLFDVNRKAFPTGAWDYFKENKDYPYYLLKDRLARATAKSTRAIKRGEGRILKLNGSKVAAFRDDNGKLIKKSAICTHMGCVVHWNDAEKTWDCPCHGSRFKPTGEVIAGPAETPLEDA